MQLMHTAWGSLFCCPLLRSVEKCCQLSLTRLACGFKALECGHGNLGKLILASSSGMTPYSLSLLAASFPDEDT